MKKIILICFAVILTIGLVFRPSNERININNMPLGQLYTIMELKDEGLIHPQSPIHNFVYIALEHESGDRVQIFFQAVTLDIKPPGTIIRGIPGGGYQFMMGMDNSVDDLVTISNPHRNPRF